MSPHHAVAAFLAVEALFRPVVGSPVNVVCNEIGQGESGTAFRKVDDAVEVDSFSGLGPHLAAVCELHAPIDQGLFDSDEMFAGHWIDPIVESSEGNYRVYMTRISPV